MHAKKSYTHKDPKVHGGLWKHENNLACTKSARVFRALELDTTGMKEKKKMQTYSNIALDKCQSGRKDTAFGFF